MMRSLFVRRCPDHNDMLRFALGLCAAVLIVLLLVIPDEAEAGSLWKGNCYANLGDAWNAYFEDQVQPQYFESVGQVYSVQMRRLNGDWYRTIWPINLSTGQLGTPVNFLVMYGSNSWMFDGYGAGGGAVISWPFYGCAIPANATDLVGNGQPTVFSNMYETAKTLVNTQVLMIFLWVVATFFLGFKFGYFVFNSGGGKHDTF